MKNRILYVIIITYSLISYATVAQTFGIRGGMNSSNARLTEYDLNLLSDYNTSSVNSTFVGLYCTVRVPYDKDYFETPIEKVIKNFSVNFELLYMENGFSVDRLKGNNEKITIKTTQLNLPIIINYNVFENFQLQFGVNMGLLLTIEEIVNNHHYNGRKELDYFDTGGVVGAELEIGNRFFVDARYYFSDKENAIDSNYTGYYKFSNRVVQLGIGFRLL